MTMKLHSSVDRPMRTLLTEDGAIEAAPFVGLGLEWFAERDRPLRPALCAIGGRSPGGPRSPWPLDARASRDPPSSRPAPRGCAGRLAPQDGEALSRRTSVRSRQGKQ